ncbi:hypothetical protein [Roseovarius sp. EL26]|uniref:hypothetical protein n=1 Tax=Roseovarius sp. EL26 TaxID=2126672 RepID=UPI001C1F9FDF|nr:hypothetical protein [Roseovarius sp. EL26]
MEHGTRTEVVMTEQRCQLFGLIGFIIAGLVFIAAGINFGDPLTIIVSVIWVISCLIWMIPLLRGTKRPYSD